MRQKKWEVICPLFLVVCVTFTLLQMKCFSGPSSTCSKKIKRHFRLPPIERFHMSSVEILGWDYQPEDEVEARLARNVVKYVLMVPHKLQPWLKSLGVAGLSLQDKQELQKLLQFLDASPNFDGAMGVLTQVRVKGFNSAKTLLEESSCTFLVKNWTMSIRNFGPIHPHEPNHREDDSSKATNWFQECNIAETAFVLRKSTFQSLRWRAECGSMSHLDFFKRSEGLLKIGKLSNCFFSPAITYFDHQILQSTGYYLDYSTLGQIHSILRIVRPDKIEWTKCTDDKQFCPEKPLTSRPNTLAAADGYPICCDVLMDEILSTLVDAMNQVGIEYRVVYGTLLGAVRSQSMVPYSDDVDLAIHKADNDQYEKFQLVQRILGSRYFVAWKANPPVTRVFAHYAPTVAINTQHFFRGADSFESDALFSSKILKEMEKLLPVKNVAVEQRYVDVYPSPEEWFENFTEVTINNRRYHTVGNADKMLKMWYGDYMKIRPELHSQNTLAT